MITRSVITVRELEESDRAWVNAFLVTHAGSARVVSRGVLHQADALPGYLALLDADVVGLLTYRIESPEMEIVSLHVKLQRRGAGTALLEAATSKARRTGCSRLWLITTNDNRQAIDFYTGRGLRLAAVHKDAVRASRRLKPEIPLLGLNGEAITDELEFDLVLSSPATGKRASR